MLIWAAVLVPEKVTENLDFIAMHLYPEKDKLAEAMETLRGFAVGKPVVIEETFPLKCSQSEMEQFISQSESVASGWISFYWGKTPEECRKGGTIGEAIMANWLEWFPKKMAELSLQSHVDNSQTINGDNETYTNRSAKRPFAWAILSSFRVATTTTRKRKR